MRDQGGFSLDKSCILCYTSLYEANSVVKEEMKKIPYYEKAYG